MAIKRTFGILLTSGPNCGGRRCVNQMSFIELWYHRVINQTSVDQMSVGQIIRSFMAVSTECLLIKCLWAQIIGHSYINQISVDQMPGCQIMGHSYINQMSVDQMPGGQIMGLYLCRPNVC